MDDSFVVNGLDDSFQEIEVETTPKPKYECTICDYSTDRKDNLKRHLLVHSKEDDHEKHDEKRFTCEICEYNTGKKSNLKRHLKVHYEAEDERSKAKFICDVCGIEFLSKFGLTLHTKNKHSHQFKYECEICNKGFNQMLPYKGHLSSHVTHTKEKCEKCNLPFQHKSSLERHVKAIHKDVKYDCAECDQQFTNKSHLRDHEKVVHCGRKLPCDMCDKVFKWRSGLTRKLHTSEY